MYKINKLYNCGIFQGEGKQRQYFEGWYFKHVDQKENRVLAIIPGISYEGGRDQAHAFIQLIDGSTCDTYYLRYGIEEFKFSKRDFEIQIGANHFSADKILLNIEKEGISLHGSLSYDQKIPWPSSLLSPGCMGWYSFVPFMECYHGVISLHHRIYGSLLLNGREYLFNEGLGYIEKDWGTSFPSSWIWLQSNHFDGEDRSLMVSVAKIPWKGKSFTGFIVGLWNQGEFYKFATYTGARIEVLIQQENGIELVICDKRHRLTVKAAQGKTGGLQAPFKGAMSGSVQESIRGTADIKLQDITSGRILLQTKAHTCGMEIAGNVQELMTVPRSL